MADAITLKMLLRRLTTVARKLEENDFDCPDPELIAEIDGAAIPLTKDNFQVDDDGTLLIDTGKA